MWVATATFFSFPFFLAFSFFQTYYFFVNIYFLGCPCSGKTTTAALIFAELKETGISCEFIPEQARFYIAEIRVKNNLQPYDPVILSDDDQISILEKQLSLQEVMRKAIGEYGIIVTDTSPVNSFLYMKHIDKNNPKLMNLLSKIESPDDIYFYCPPVAKAGPSDPNRIHSYEQSLKIDESLPEILQEHFPNIYKRLITLTGTPAIRQTQVFSEVMNRRLG